MSAVVATAPVVTAAVVVVVRGGVVVAASVVTTTGVVAMSGASRPGEGGESQDRGDDDLPHDNPSFY